MADIIVYGQKELEAAIDKGIKSITLCAGIYTVSKTADTVFDRLGPVKVSVCCTKREAEACNMVFCGIYPEYTEEESTLCTLCAGTGFGSVANSFSGLLADSVSYTGSFKGSGAISSGSVSGSGGIFYVSGYGINLI